MDNNVIPEPWDNLTFVCYLILTVAVVVFAVMMVFGDPESQEWQMGLLLTAVITGLYIGYSFYDSSRYPRQQYQDLLWDFVLNVFILTYLVSQRSYIMGIIFGVLIFTQFVERSFFMRVTNPFGWVLTLVFLILLISRPIIISDFLLREIEDASRSISLPDKYPSWE